MEEDWSDSGCAAILSTSIIMTVIGILVVVSWYAFLGGH